MTEVGGNGSRGKSVLVVTTTTFVLATIFVAARLLSRFVVLKHRTADDWFIILSWFIAFGLSFSIDWGTSKGLGRYDPDIPEAWRGSLYQTEYAFTILYNPALMATKTSILIFYLRMARNTQKLLRIASYVTMAIVNIAGVVLTFLNAFQCSPVRAAYIPNIPGKCLSIVTLYLCSAPVNIITDLVILVLPIPVLTGMRLPQRQKTVLVLTFGLGIFVTVVDVIRIYYLQQAVDSQDYAQGRLGTTLDLSWSTSSALMWSAVEVNVGIICACIPTLKPLIKQILPSMIADPSRNGTAKEISSDSQVAPDGFVEPAHRLSSSGHPVGIRPLPPAQLGGNQAEEMGMMDFLTTPGMDLHSGQTNTQDTRAADSTVYFGFIDMRRPKSMLKTKGTEAFKYCTIVTILFFLWGFSYGLLNTLNNEISTVARQTVSQTLGLTTAYFGGYLFGPLTVGQWTLRNSGFKATFITGLCIYGTGTLMFWPSAVLKSFPGFIISNFVVGFGLSVLETAANPFLALCGPAEYAEFRLLLAQGVQGIGSILSQLLAQKALFSSVRVDLSLIDVQWTYLAVALFTVVLALFFYYMPLPEATDTDLQIQSDDLGIYTSTTILTPRLPLIYLTLGLAVFAQLLYVGAQEAMSVYFSSLLTSLSKPHTTSSLALSLDNYSILALTTFAVGRFLFAPLCLIIPPRILLLFTFLAGIVFSTLTMSLDLTANGIAGPALVFFLFESPVWPLIFAMGLRGMGRRTKMAAALLTAAASGGAIFQFVMFAVQRVSHQTVQYSFCVIVALFAFGTIFPIYLNLVPGARHQVDPAKPMGLGEDELRHARGGIEASEPSTPIRRLSKGFGVVFEKIRGRGRESGEMPVVEHRESRRRSS
ncbi:L-fucose permease [Hyphodiscus hymeniophilus]|uniref:L-fucose permease n=1 Tax=Hyphodiscus hymeniophilus TaxID=353542 RepID=A0A9P7AUY7_9HELO|nr:L-fucose permease [Hyphodiscus hymeniophilus]